MSRSYMIRFTDNRFFQSVFFPFNLFFTIKGGKWVNFLSIFFNRLKVKAFHVILSDSDSSPLYFINTFSTQLMQTKKKNNNNTDMINPVRTRALH